MADDGPRLPFAWPAPLWGRETGLFPGPRGPYYEHWPGGKVLPLTPYTVERFGALNLVDDPLEVGATGATEVVNVDFDRQGRVRTRDGYLNVVVLTGTSADGLATFENSAGLKQFVVAYQNGGTKKYEAYSSTGAPRS
jgi:hypothetical protein